MKHSCSRIRQNSGITGDTTEVWRPGLPAQRRENMNSNASRRCGARPASMMMGMIVEQFVLRITRSDDKGNQVENFFSRKPVQQPTGHQ